MAHSTVVESYSNRSRIVDFNQRIRTTLPDAAKQWCCETRHTKTVFSRQRIEILLFEISTVNDNVYLQ